MMTMIAIFLAIVLAATGLVVIGLILFTVASVRRAERLVPADGRFLDVPGARLHYTDRGSGRAILLIHGLGGQLRNFADPLVTHLARAHRVIAVDRPGSGYSTVVRSYPNLRRQAAMIAALIEQLDLGPVVLAGHSLGGALSLALVLDRPDLVSSLALMAPLTQHLGDAPSAFKILTIRSALVRRLIGWTIVAPFGRHAGKARRSPVFAPETIPANFESQGGGALLYRPPGFDAASRDLQDMPESIPGLMARYPTIARPVSVLFGRGDRILDPMLHGERFVSQVPGATLTLIDGGHMVPFTQPVAAAEWIEAVSDGFGT